MIEREEQAEVCHSHSYIVYTANSLWKFGTNLQDVCLSGAEDRYRTIRFFRIAVQIRVVLRVIVVESESAAHVCNADGLFSFCINRERVLGNIVLYAGRKHLLQSPYTRIVVGSVELYVACVNLVEIEFPFLGVVQSAVFGKFQQVVRCHVVF